MKTVLDVTCGARMMWFDKKNPHTLFVDERTYKVGTCKVRPHFEVNPDVVASFSDLPFENERFNLVVFDPPHMIRSGPGGLMAIRYGRLFEDTWERELRGGFSECWRVLKCGGTLVFKWSECDLKMSDIKHLFPVDPMFGSKGGRRGETIWLVFYKP